MLHLWRGWGVLQVKMLHCIKFCLKSISSHPESFWKKNLGKNWGVPQYFLGRKKYFFDSAQILF